MTPTELPPTVPPMLATAGPVPRGPGWAFEMKWDGVRAVVAVANQVRAISRNNRDITPSYPELAGLPSQLGGRRVVLDGELVALDHTGVPSFARLQHRMHVAHPDPRLLARVPVRYYVFDLLYLDGEEIVGRPYRARREALEGLVRGDGPGNGPAVVPPRFEADGQVVLAVARENGLEGVVAKRLDSVYLPGRRSRDWIKTPLITTTEVIVGGWRPGAGRRAGSIGSLLLGAYDEERRLVYVGQVGTGFTDADLSRLAERFAPLERQTPPFDTPVPRELARDAHWLEPVLVAEVVYRNLTPERRLRHPSWRGLRPDRTPAEVRVEALR